MLPTPHRPGDFATGGLIDRALKEGSHLDREIMIDARNLEVGLASVMNKAVAHVPSQERLWRIEGETKSPSGPSGPAGPATERT